ncbi:CKLF-like MARVEL transmembrane domain-containing protein 6 [Labeo rohita]|uniref:CKLF-like MARVEL transmembrane domain-containing protein 6 n=1 Tax=Labeo rohita TaxID=84645 RepID=A0ABQ8LXK4_LABRO|nr:CKLF-like MARVEL transmembrane domain-containing protein 6 [Labeo rohita]
MATETVYNATTTVQEPKSKKWFIVPSENLDKVRFGIKVVEVLLSFVAFVMEEVVSNCTECGPLYFFEFVSCTAFLFTLLLLILLATTIVFGAGNGNTALEQGAVAFGFLATVAFCADFGLFIKYRGTPCQKRNNQQADQAPRPESEKLNANGAESN